MFILLFGNINSFILLLIVKELKEETKKPSIIKGKLLNKYINILIINYI